MMNFKNDLYRSEWLELVFAGRNKVYGAYELRQHNDHTTLKALITGIALIIAGVLSPFIYSRFAGKEIISDASRQDKVLRVVEYSVPKRSAEKAPLAAKPKVVTAKSQAIRFISMKLVTPPQVIDEVPAIKELEGTAIGPVIVNLASTDGALNAMEPSALTDNPGSAAETVSDEPVKMEMLEKYPDFPGGQKAFYKYISRNLRYPMIARENNISGRVIVSFIVEKNGVLSNIKVVSGIGSGCDEEAIRVLKNSPAWSPGLQNGQNVRVAYTIPLSFVLSE